MQYTLKHLCQVEMNTNAMWRVCSKALCCVRQAGKLHLLQPPACRPVTLRVSVKRYSRFMPQGFGEHSLHWRTINLQLFPATALPMLEGSLGRAVPGFDCGYLLKHWQTMARSCLERTTTPCLLQLVSRTGKLKEAK